MKKRRIIYSKKKHSEKGIFSFVLGIIVLVSLIVSIILSYRLKGNAPTSFGAAGFLCTLFSVVGIILGVVGKQEADKFHLFAYIGLCLNILDLLFISTILYAGI